MKKLEAIIKPFYLESVKEALQNEGIIGMTVSEVMDFGCPSSGARTSPAKDFSPRLKLEVVVADGDIARALETIQRFGVIMGSSEPFLVHEVEDVVRIRTAEHGETAI